MSQIPLPARVSSALSKDLKCLGFGEKVKFSLSAWDHILLVQVEAEKPCPCGLMLSFSECSLAGLHFSLSFQSFQMIL